MARKHDLRRQRAGTVLNLTSKQQETAAASALRQAVRRLEVTFAVSLAHKKDWLLAEIVEHLRKEYPDVPFSAVRPTSSMRPDGGILFLVDRDGVQRPILIVEVKNQGTNDLRMREGKRPQAMGNAIERLGKNVIGFRTALLPEGIMPFVCFGDGCDFAETSSIRDRVVTIAMFGPLNEINVVPAGEGAQFNRGSFFFQEQPWSEAKMAEVMFEVASRSIHYYFAKYGQAQFSK
jgi:type II restriction enzyme